MSRRKFTARSTPENVNKKANMLKTLRNQFILLLSSLAFLFGAISVANALPNCPANTGCPEYEQDSFGFKPGSNVKLLINDSTGASFSDITAAIIEMNNNSIANGSLTTFTVVSSLPSSGPKLTLNVDYTSANGSASACGGIYTVGCTMQTGSPMNTLYATTTIFLGSSVCGGPCFDSSQPNYHVGIQHVVKHELTHTLGVGDALGPGTLMSPRIGVNNEWGQSNVTPCDIAATKAAVWRLGSGLSQCTPNP